MNKLKKWLIGALTAATLAGAIAIATKKSPAKEVQITKEISYNKAQEYLDTAFERAKYLTAFLPSNASRRCFSRFLKL